METGIKHEVRATVTPELTAASVGSGSLQVYATPSMVALMEQTAAESVQPHLDEGITSVGTKINVEHLAADPVGIEVTCESTLT